MVSPVNVAHAASSYMDVLIDVLLSSVPAPFLDDI